MLCYYMYEEPTSRIIAESRRHLMSETSKQRDDQEVIMIPVYIYALSSHQNNFTYPPRMTELGAFSAPPSTILSRMGSINSKKLPRRVSTAPTSGFSTKVTQAPAKKRIIVCCDG